MAFFEDRDRDASWYGGGYYGSEYRRRRAGWGPRWRGYAETDAEFERRIYPYRSYGRDYRRSRYGRDDGYGRDYRVRPEQSLPYGRGGDRAVRRWASHHGYDVDYSIRPGGAGVSRARYGYGSRDRRDWF